jgi:hypothetical protein
MQMNADKMRGGIGVAAARTTSACICVHLRLHILIHSARPMAIVRNFSDVRSIKLTASMIRTMIAPISW